MVQALHVTVAVDKHTMINRPLSTTLSLLPITYQSIPVYELESKMKAHISIRYLTRYSVISGKKCV